MAHAIKCYPIVASWVLCPSIRFIACGFGFRVELLRDFVKRLLEEI